MIDRTIDNGHVAVVLNQPKLSENIGTTARAAANMGLGRLIVVNPYFLDKHIILAAGTRAAHDLVENMTVKDDLVEALSEFHYVIGTSARQGSHRGPFFNPRTMAAHLTELGSEQRIALLFGPERSGLTTEDLRLCQAVVRIPTANSKTSSLNLAQAVLILGYELLLAAAEPASENNRLKPRIKPAPMNEVQAMYDHLEETLVNIGFLPDKNTGHWLMSFKRIFNRSGLTHGDCNLIRGVCRQIKWAIRTGGKSGR